MLERRFFWLNLMRSQGGCSRLYLSMPAAALADFAARICPARSALSLRDQGSQRRAGDPVLAHTLPGFEAVGA